MDTEGENCEGGKCYEMKREGEQEKRMRRQRVDNEDHIKKEIKYSRKIQIENRRSYNKMSYYHCASGRAPKTARKHSRSRSQSSQITPDVSRDLTAIKWDNIPGSGGLAPVYSRQISDSLPSKTATIYDLTFLRAASAAGQAEPLRWQFNARLRERSHVTAAISKTPLLQDFPRRRCG